MTDKSCTNCGQPPGECYHLCFNSPAFYSPEQEREDEAWYGMDDHNERYAAERADMANEGWHEDDIFVANSDGTVTLITGTDGKHTYDPNDIRR
jgi:hypothetical protein